MRGKNAVGKHGKEASMSDMRAAQHFWIRFAATPFLAAIGIGTAHAQSAFGGVAPSANAADTTVNAGDAGIPPIATGPAIGSATLPTIGAPTMPEIGTSTPTTIGTAMLPTIGTPTLPTIGTPTLPTIGTPTLPTIGTPTLPTIGTSTTPTIGTSLAPAIDAAFPAIGTSRLPTIGTTLDATIGTSLAPASSIGTGTLTPIGATRSPGAAELEVPPLAPGIAVGGGGAGSAAGFGGGVSFESQCLPQDFTCTD
jgi:hypothetical protein